MVAVHTIAWEEAMSPDFGNPARVAWREAVTEIADKAKAALPETVNGRIEKAVAIVLNGDVEVLPEGKAKVASQAGKRVLVDAESLRLPLCLSSTSS